jgi:disulfide oxidoreductase YuzD
MHALNTVGFINESCVFDPSKWTFEWLLDAQGRKVPYASYHGHKWKINNLHIHSKNLAGFRSK